jgi:Domain of unknown function (DUF4157)
MSQERRFRGGLERPFDWRALARRHGIPEHDARGLYEEAVRQAGAYREPRRYQETIYLELLEGARPTARGPSPGKVTRTMRLQAERAGKRRRSSISRLTGQPIAPGKVTLASYVDSSHGSAHGRAHGRHDESLINEEGARLARHQAPSEPGETRADATTRPVETSLAVALGDVDTLDARDRALLADEYGIDVAVPHAGEDIAAWPLPPVTWTSTPAFLAQTARPMERPAMYAARLEVAQDASSDWRQALQRERAGAPGDAELPGGSGEPLPPALRARMETAFDHDFSHVRIHTDSASGDAARQMKAHAVAQGSHVF